MDKDTIFSALRNDEQIRGKYQYYSFVRGVEVTAILTDYRLLTRSKQTICCCCHRSSYSAISLETIHSIKEHYAHPRAFIYLSIWIFWLLAGVAGVLVSFFYAKDSVRTIGIVVSIIPVFLTSLVVFTCLCCCFKYKTLQLTGTFGSIEFSLDKQQARLFETDLSERISQAKIRLQPVPSERDYYSSIESFAREKRLVLSAWH